jgi:nucleoside-diphosphate-sugar epimerase
MTQRLFIFGYGYTAAHLTRRLLKQRWEIAATTRNPLKQQELRRLGITPYDFHDPEISVVLNDYEYVLISIPPTKNGDTVLLEYADTFRHYTGKWIGFLSTTGVYGDHQGAWVDETTQPAPNLSSRRQCRLDAENAWLKLHSQHQKPVHIFRLAGIYGAGKGIGNRNELAESIVKEGHYFSRIHAEDIAGALDASMQRPHPGRIYNLADDEPAPKIEVIRYAARLLHLPPPQEIPYQPELLEGMAAEFWKHNKRVSNQRMKQELAYSLHYPTYREGLKAIYGVTDESKNQAAC